MIHRWSFNGNFEDSVGNLTATTGGAVRWDTGSADTAKQVRLCGNGHGGGWINLGQGIVPAEAGGSVTIEIWASQHMVANWSRVFDFGSDTSNYILMSWTQGTDINTDREEIKDAGTTILQGDQTLRPFALGVKYHISMVITPADEGKATLSWAKRDVKTGAVIASGSGTTSAAWDANKIAGWGNCFLGRSEYDGDADAIAMYDEVRIWKTALTTEQLNWSARLGPDALPSIQSLNPVALNLTSDNGVVSVNGAAGVGSGTVAIARETDATLVATPANGYNFVRWSGDTGRIISGSVDTPEITIYTMPGELSLTAEYEANTPAVYAKIENNQFKYLTANRKSALEPDGGMNDGITILFDSDAEYQQLKTQSTEVAKAAGVQLGGDVKLTSCCDWTEIPYSLGTSTLDLNGKALKTKVMNAGSAPTYAIPLVNSNFEADTASVNSGENIRIAPQGWEIGGGVWLIKNNLTYGWNNTQNGSVWCVTDVGGYIQQKFNVDQSGNLTVSYSNSSAVGWYAAWSSYAVKIDGVIVQSETNIHWNYGDRSFTTFVGAGTHTIQFTCNGAGGGSVHGIEWDNISLNFTPKGAYTSSNGSGVINGNFEANSLNSGDCIQKIPEGWGGGGEVLLLKNNYSYGWNNTANGSVWCVTKPGAYIEQTFCAVKTGNITVRYDNSSAVGQYTAWSSYAVKVDGVVVQSENGIHWQPAGRSFTTEVTPGLHTIQFTCTGSSSGVQGIEWDNISISGAPGVLEVVVPEGQTLANNDVSILGGGNLAVVKSGAGTFAANKTGQSYSGGNYVQGGLMTFAANSALGSSGEVLVESGATLELGGKYDLNTFTFVLNGGTLQNTGADIGEGAAQITTLRLTADSTFKPTSSYGLIGSGYGATTLDLAGHTLTVPIGVGKFFYLYNTTVTAGTLDVTSGGWLVADKTAVNAGEVNLRANCALDIRVPFTLNSYEALFGADYNAGNVPFTLSGTFKPHSSYYHGVNLAENATIDLSACSGVLYNPGLFTSGSKEIFFQNVYTPVEWIESSGSQYIHTGIIPGANTVVDLDFSTLGYKEDSTIFGCASWNGNRFLFIEQGNQLRFYGGGTAVKDFVANQRYTFKVTAAHKAELYDSEQTLLSSVAIDPTNADNTQMTLFALNGGGYTGIYRLHAMKIYDGETLVRDFVPCHDQLGTFGLWERVEGKFYGNQGTGAFTGPAEAAGAPIYIPSTLNVNLHGRNLTGSKIVGWGTAPTNVTFVPTAETKADHYNLDVRADGIYVPRNTVIIFR